MKKITMILAVLALTVGAATAQKKGTSDAKTFSVGLELGMPMGDFGDLAKLGIGGSVKYAKPMGDNGALTGTVGYSSFAGKDAASGATWSILSFKAGYQFKMDGGLYVEPQLGFGSLSTKIDLGGVSATASSSGLLYAAGVGYVINNTIDLSARYESISITGGSVSLVGIRVAYAF